MDDFNNFFDDQREDGYRRTPIYHTPDNNPSPSPKKRNGLAVAAFIFAIFMCVLVVVNVIVLASLKSQIAKEYAASIEDMMQEQYSQAIDDAIEDKDIVSDVVEQVKQDATKTIGELADSLTPSVAIITATNSGSSGGAIGSGFLISDTDSAGGVTARYLVTNAHVVQYEKATLISSSPFGSNYSYSFALYNTITCTFENDTTVYSLQIIAYGSYPGDYASAESPHNTQSDLALLRFVGTQPDETAHPSLKIATSDYTQRGEQTALIGNPQNYGISVTTGTISLTDLQFSDWTTGTFLMTDAAINGGNSGGPMINEKGVVIGVVESKLSSEEIENMGFAVSAGTLVSFLEWSKTPSHNQLGAALNIPYLTQAKS
jgi:S1-C subfamily serine protease